MALDRRLMTALLAMLVLADMPGTARAQFGYFFDDPGPPMRRAPRRRAYRPPPDVVDVPLPVPRPRFPGDPPTVAPEAAKPEPAKPAIPAEPDIAAPAKEKPVQPTPDIAAPEPAKPSPDDSAPPLPPTRPPETELKPGAPPPDAERPAEMAKPKPPAEAAPPPEAKPPAPSAGPPDGASAPTPPPKPPDLAKPAAPNVAPSGARLGEAPGQPDDDATCQDRVKARGVDIEPLEIGPQPDPRCTVVRAVKLKGVSLPGGGKVDIPEHPTIACTTADAFSTYVRDLLSPLAKGTFGAPVASVWTGPGLECRSRDHIFGAKLSSHGQGLAIDIAQLKLADGKMIEVGNAKDETGQNFETAARNAACGYFHTVLGPGSDSYHRTHWHFDLEVRGAKGDSKYCK